ncbi:hypothetical protein SAMN05216276_106741 [Streptosporangium subroseum]|uniref:Uncharacterized protein n=2 Tax=Streptosporangium subroseum TaxID=106412 RepID=A0A239NSP1_9ACTN|nr:hypothetical protein SAMN05216276_106741 [Streptosporangium subroseum]
MISPLTFQTLRHATVLLCVAAVTGCSAIPWIGITTPREASDLTLPLDVYELGPKDRAQVLRVRFTLIKKCMQQFQIDFQGPSTEPVYYPKNAIYLDWLDENWAESYGYAEPPGQAEERSAAMSGIRSYVIQDEQSYVLWGKVKRFRGKAVPRGGCLAKADGILNQGAKGLSKADSEKTFNDEEIAALATGSADLILKDERIKAAERSWSSCMMWAGFVYQTPDDAMGDPQWASTVMDDQIKKPRGTQAEINTATADAKCRLDTNYYGARQASYSDSQNKIIEKHRDRLNTIKLLNQTRLANSAKVLSGEIVVPW